MDPSPPSEDWQLSEFYSYIRDEIIQLLAFILLCGVAYAVLVRVSRDPRRKPLVYAQNLSEASKEHVKDYPRDYAQKEGEKSPTGKGANKPKDKLARHRSVEKSKERSKERLVDRASQNGSPLRSLALHVGEEERALLLKEERTLLKEEKDNRATAERDQGFKIEDEQRMQKVRALEEQLDLQRENEDFRSSLPFFILVGGLAVVFSLQFLLPLTLLLRKIMLDHSQSEYVAWLTTPLLVTTWNKLFFISGIYVFGLIPFAYLSQEAMDLKRSLLSAGWETLTQLFFVFCFLTGIVYVARATFNFHNAPFYLVLHWFTLLLSALFCIKAIPFGFALLIRSSWKLSVSLYYRKNIASQLEQLGFERDILEAKIQKFESDHPEWVQHPPSTTAASPAISAPLSPSPAPARMLPRAASSQKITDDGKSLSSLENSVRSMPNLSYIHGGMLGFLREIIFEKRTERQGDASLDDLSSSTEELLGSPPETPVAEESPLDEASPLLLSSPPAPKTGPRRAHATASSLHQREKYRELRQQLAAIDKQRDQVSASQLGRFTVFARNVLFLVTLSANLVLFVLFAIALALSGIKGLWNPEDLIGLRGLPGFFTSIHSDDTLTWGEVLMEVSLVCYVNIAAILGIYSMSEFSRALRSPHGMVIPDLAVNIVILLILSSTLPVIVRLLGVTTINVTGIFTFYGFLKNYPIYTFSYKMIMLASSLREFRAVLVMRPHPLR